MLHCMTEEILVCGCRRKGVKRVFVREDWRACVHEPHHDEAVELDADAWIVVPF